MYIESVQLKNFRNYDSLELDLAQGTNIFYGNNAQGKTNILEALYLCGTTKSHKGSRDKDMIQFGKDESHIRMMVKRDELSYSIISVNRKTREVTSSGRAVELTLKEFELLSYLLENQSRVVTRDELLNRIWGYEYDGETRTLDMHIRTLRQKLGEDGGSCIKTVRGVGYRLVKQEGTL